MREILFGKAAKEQKHSPHKKAKQNGYCKAKIAHSLRYTQSHRAENAGKVSPRKLDVIAAFIFDNKGKTLGSVECGYGAVRVMPISSNTLLTITDSEIKKLEIKN